MKVQTEIPDETLVLKTIEGDRRSFEVLVRKYNSKLYRFIRQKTFSDEEAEDLVQDSFYKAYKNLKSFNPEFRFSTWLYTIAFRLSVDRSRYLKRREPQIEVTDKIDKLSVFHPETYGENIWEFAKKLKTVYFRVLLLRYGEGMSVSEISSVLGKTSINTRVLLHRARSKLLKIYSFSAGKNISDLQKNSVILSKGD